MSYSFTNDRPIYIQLMEMIERDIASGVLPPGSRMPSVRDLASQIGISPNTVQRAMYEMERSGLLVSRGTEGKTITEDAGRIAQMRIDLAGQTIEQYFSAMRQLGFEDGESARLAGSFASGSEQKEG